MTQGGRQSLVFIHGVGGAPAEDEWLEPLSNVMAELGSSRPEFSNVDVVTVSYQAELLGEEMSEASDVPALTWRKPDDLATHHAAYQVSRAEREGIARGFAQTPSHLTFGLAPDEQAAAAAQAVEASLSRLRLEAGRYRRNASARAAVLESVIRQMPDSGRAVVIAHSLGSVVAVDVVKRLSPRLQIDGLVTIGSPLPLRGRWPFVELTGDDFPYDRVRSWVNVFDSLDPVTGGRGVGRLHPEALDVDVHFGTLPSLLRNHGVKYYLSLPVVGAMVSQALYGSVDGRRLESDRVPARRLSDDWDLHLLGAAYAFQLSATCDPKKHPWRRKYDAARKASVLRFLANVDERRSDLRQEAQAIPSSSDFLDHAAGLIRHTWADEELVPLCVGLLLASPVSPFEIKVRERHASEAMSSLLDRIRRSDSNLSDHLFSAALTDSVDEARRIVGGRSAWWALMLLGGAAVLAATGVGILVAAPTGLAGAALLTSTLAAFGPGGMVGGMVTIAAASSAGSALLGAGVTQAGRDRAQRSAEFAASVAALPVEMMRGALTGWVASIIAEKKLDMPSSAAQVRALLISAHTKVVTEENDHTAFGSAAAKDWKERRELIEQVSDWLDKAHPSALIDEAKAALASGEGRLKLNSTALRELRARNVDSKLE